MKIKVCGLNNQGNITQLKGLGLDFMGFIFYDKSKRSIAYGDVDELFVKYVSEAKKVGVFVDSKIEEVIQTINKYGLDLAQLHGNESPAFCKDLKDKGYKIIKAISVLNEMPSDILDTYKDVVDMFLFDTSGKGKGGNGVKFDWQLLADYKLKVPYLLAGGISLEDTSEIKKLDLKMLYGVDLNSRFEIEPGIKDINKVKKFIKDIK